jgi:hypothetical protein
VFKAGAAKERAQIMGTAMGGLKEAKTQSEIQNINSQIEARRADIVKQARAAADAEIQRQVITDPQEQERVYQKHLQNLMRDANIPTFAGTGSATGLGGGAGLGGRPMIMDVSGQIR